VTLSAQGRGRHEAIVVVIEQNHWLKEWRYMIRIEEMGKSPELLITILDRGILNSQDISTRISPEAVILTEGDVAFFFNEFERPIQETIFQKGRPGFYETVRLTQPLQAQLPPSMKLQDIESHRLFTADMWPSYMDNLTEETQSGPIPKSMIKWGPKIYWDSTSDYRRGTVIVPLQEMPIIREDTWHHEMFHLGSTKLENQRDVTSMVEGKRKFLPGEGCTVVIPKKRRLRGTLSQRILIQWRNVTIPCTFSAWLTPATVITDIGNSARASIAALIKATLTPPENLLATLHMDTPLSTQGIANGDTLILLVLHATILDPYDKQHLVAYREEDTMQYFLTALRDISPIPPLSEIILYHNDLHLDPTSRFQDCNLPHEPTLHVRFSNHPDAHPRTESTQPEPTGTEALPMVPTNASLAVDKDLDTQRETQDMGTAEGGMVMALRQTFVQDLEGKTHVLPFSLLDSIEKKLLRHSSQLYLPPLR